MKNWPKFLLVTAFGISKSGFAEEGGKKFPTDACLFYHVFSLFLSLFLFLSLCYFPLSSLCFLSLGSSFLFLVIAPIYNGQILWDFSFLLLGFYQLFMVCDGHPFRATHQPIGCPSTTTTGYAQCILFLPLPIRWQISLFVWSCYKPSLLFEWIRLWSISLPTFLAFIKWSQLSTTTFGQNVIPAKYFPKRGPGWKLKINSFPPFTKPHPLNSLNVDPFLLCWLGTSWWCSGCCVLVALLSAFVFFHSHTIFAVAS